jgi:hypothetical protein
MSQNQLSVMDLSRLAIADELIHMADTVAILTCAEVEAIRERALTGEFDNIFAAEALLDEIEARVAAKGKP